VSKRRAEILALSAELFARRGFANVTVDEIGDAAGVSGPALYHHFAGKEALLGEMLVDVSRYLLDGGRRIVDDHGAEPPQAVLDALVRFHVDFAITRRSLITVHFREFVHAAPADRAMVRGLQGRYIALWVDVLQRCHPALDRRSAEAAVHATFGMLNSTPFSSRVAAVPIAELLRAMALRALDVDQHGSQRSVKGLAESTAG
jgi:AcrR family transcriptional regulator